MTAVPLCCGASSLNADGASAFAGVGGGTSAAPPSFPLEAEAPVNSTGSSTSGVSVIAREDETAGLAGALSAIGSI